MHVSQGTRCRMFCPVIVLLAVLGQSGRRAGRPSASRKLLHSTSLLLLLPSLPCLAAVGMFVSGHLGDRVDLRYFLTGAGAAGWVGGWGGQAAV